MKFNYLIATVLFCTTASSFAGNYYWGYNAAEKNFGFVNEAGTKVGWKEAILGAATASSNTKTKKATNTTVDNSRIIVPSIHASELLPTLFSNTQVSGKYNSSELKYPFIAARQNIDGEKELRFLQQHPTLAYQNAQNQTRYFVFIESIPTIGNDIDACHGCYVKGYLLNFKKLSNGQYELTNQNTVKLVDIPSAWGQSQMIIMDIQKGLQRVGANAVGAIFESGFTSGGITESLYNLLALNDDQVKIIPVAEAGTEGQRYVEAKDDQVDFGYSSSYKILTTEPAAQFYPVQITYKGTDWNFKKKQNTVVVKYDHQLDGYPEQD